MVDFIVNLFAEIADLFITFWVDNVVDKFAKRNKSLRKESKVMQTKKQSWLFCNCPFVCITFDFSWLNKARPGSHYIWTFNPPGLLTKYTAYGHMSTGS